MITKLSARRYLQRKGIDRTPVTRGRFKLNHLQVHRNELDYPTITDYKRDAGKTGKWIVPSPHPNDS